MVDEAGPEDLFIVVISGGSSALMSCPIDGITLQDEIDTTEIMLKSGANILEINAIRRHISALNGGMLAKRIEQTGAELIGIGISDAVGTPATGDIGIPYAHYKGTPMGPDQTTLEEARRVHPRLRCGKKAAQPGRGLFNELRVRRAKPQKRFRTTRIFYSILSRTPASMQKRFRRNWESRP